MLFSTACCAALATQLPNVIFSTGSQIYHETELSYWSTQEALLSPSCVVQPTSSKDVSMFITAVANRSDCQFAIKGQGHAPNSGFANIEGGVTLDMTYLNETSLSADMNVASVGPGSSWIEVYRTLNPYNKTVAGGRNGAVGVGGLTVGGGISYYSPQVGWTCDTVVNYEVVLASGEIVNANGAFNSDLYRALKGGGNNFGVVTKIDFQTVEIVPLLGGHVFNEEEYVYDVLNAFNNIAASPEYDIHASIVTSLSFNSTARSWTVVNVPQYTLPELNPAVYSELFAIPNITSLTSMTIQNISTLSAEPSYPQKYELFYTSTYAASATQNVLTALFNECNETLHGSNIPQGVSWSLVFEPLPTTFWSHGIGTNVLGFDNSIGNSIILLWSISWTNGSFEAIQAVSSSVLQEMDQKAANLGMLREFRYLNYAASSQDPFGSYGSQEVQFLRNVSIKYDPRGMFQQQVPGGFKVDQIC